MVLKAIKNWVFDTPSLSDNGIMLSAQDWKVLEDIANFLEVRSIINLSGTII